MAETSFTIIFGSGLVRLLGNVIDNGTSDVLLWLLLCAVAEVLLIDRLFVPSTDVRLLIDGLPLDTIDGLTLAPAVLDNGLTLALDRGLALALDNGLTLALDSGLDLALDRGLVREAINGFAFNAVDKLECVDDAFWWLWFVLDDIETELNEEAGPIDVLVAERCTSLFEAFVMTLVGMLNESLVMLLDGGNKFDRSGFLIAFGPASGGAVFVDEGLADVGYKLNGYVELLENVDMYLAKLYGCATADDDGDVSWLSPLNTLL